MAAEVSLKTKLALILFGILAAAIPAELTLRYLRHLNRGSQFQNQAELQAAILREDQASSNDQGTTLRALINPHPNPRIIYDLRPNLGPVEFQRAAVRTNSCGMRDAERSIVKPPGLYRIALLGDSFAFGWGVEESQGTAAILERTLNTLQQRLNSQRVREFQVLNFGVPGYATFQEVALFRDRVAEFQPDAIIVFFVENDFGPPFFMQDVGSGESGGLLSVFAFTQLAKQAADPRYQEHQLEIQGLDPNRSLRELSDLTRSQGIRLILFPNPKTQWLKDRKRLPILRERPDIKVADIRTHFNRALTVRNISKESLTLSFDPHPSPLKHQLMGELLAPYFMDVL